MYKCVMVIVSVYGYIGKQTDGIDRHKDREIGREAIHPDAYLSGLVGSVHFGSGWFGWLVGWLVGSVQIVCLYKKFF